MTELDFDELDRAVNSLMANVDTTKRREGLDDPVEKVVSLDSPSEDTDSTPEAPKPAEPAAAPAPTVPTDGSPAQQEEARSEAPSTLAVKRRGQFMDVMHPSSDMKTTRSARREGVVIQPSATALAAEKESRSEVPAQPTRIAPAFEMESTVTSDADKAPASTPAGAPENIVPPVERRPESAQSDAVEASSPVESELLVASDAPEPLATPFLPDAKVEKRPLGANASFEPEAEPPKADTESSSVVDAPPEGQSTSSTPESEQAPTPEPLPAELQSDVVAIEATEVPTQPPVAELPIETESTVKSEPPVVETTTSSTEPESTPAVSAGGSIPQQYTEQESSNNQPNGSIYDTASYHKPIDTGKPPKRSSVVKWVLWVIFLLVVGAGAGVAYYYFTR